MDMDSQSWLIYYENLKKDFQGKKRVGNIVPANDIQSFLYRITDLEKELNTMRESPMQYDL
jgi:hypothetical protein